MRMSNYRLWIRMAALVALIVGNLTVSGMASAPHRCERCALLPPDWGWGCTSDLLPGLGGVDDCHMDGDECHPVGQSCGV